MGEDAVNLIIPPVSMWHLLSPYIDNAAHGSFWASESAASANSGAFGQRRRHGGACIASSGVR